MKKTPLLGEKDKALTLIYKEEEKTRIEAQVKEGFAVAEVKLQYCKEDANNEDWEKLLDPRKGDLKTTELYLKVEAREQVFKVVNNGVFLKDEPFELLPAVSVYKIYQKGKITKLHREGAKKGRYYYYDSSNKEHYLGKYNYTKITNNYSWNKKYGRTKKINLVNLKEINTYSNGAVKFGLTMNNETLFLEELKQVKLYGLLFNNYQAAHEKDKTMPCKIGNLIHCLPVTFEETIQTVNQDKALKEKHIVITGTMKKLGDDVERRIENYLTYFDIKNTPITLSSYKRDVILDTDTGYPKSVTLDIALTNGNGYIRKQRFNLKIKSNG